ncbi:hypothetical protein [Actinophytocola sp.]|uniref:hypothetical protein n=1 Tax=Actinophytocola sp. TaxID=1872138 RepID=UPI002ED49FFD
MRTTPLPKPAVKLDRIERQPGAHDPTALELDRLALGIRHALADALVAIPSNRVAAPLARVVDGRAPREACDESR